MALMICCMHCIHCCVCLGGRDIFAVSVMGIMRCFRGCCLGALSAGACAYNNEIDVAESNSAVLFLWLVLTLPWEKVTVTVLSSLMCFSLIPAGLHLHLSVFDFFAWQLPIVLALVLSVGNGIVVWMMLAENCIELVIFW